MSPEAENQMPRYRNPVPTVDIIIEIKDDKGRPGIVLVERGHPPPGWAIPGGFVEYGETLEEAAVREAREETSLEVRLLGQFHTYSAPNRDPRKHTISTVFLATAEGIPQAHDDAREARIFSPKALPAPLAFDHAQILADFFEFKRRRNGCRRTYQPTAPRSGGSHGRTKAQS
jgi:ADP-ribose pyrophosphatase YjhB (NUDIX family)